MSTSAPPAVESTALAKDRLGIPAVLFFILSAMAPMTVAAGVVTIMYAVTGLSAIGAAFVAVALVLAVLARPIPEPAPVTMAVLPAKRPEMNGSSGTRWAPAPEGTSLVLDMAASSLGRDGS